MTFCTNPCSTRRTDTIQQWLHCHDDSNSGDDHNGNATLAFAMIDNDSGLITERYN